MLKNLILFHIFLLLLFTFCKNNSTSPNQENPDNIILASDIVAGEVKGKMVKTNSPYRVNGDITIPSGRTLTIEPGVEVIFQGHYKCKVKGRLLAKGTPSDTITFTAVYTDSGWHGISLDNISSSNDSSIFEYCKFQYGKANTGVGLKNRGGGAIYTSVNKLRISCCLFRQNMSYDPDVYQTGGGAIAFVGGNPLVEYCDFKFNSSEFGAAMVIWGGSNCRIRNNHFYNNNGHGIINIGNGSAPLLINNLIENNTSTQHGNVHFSNGSGIAVLINNTIVNNTSNGGGAVYINDNSPHLFMNNIVYGNRPRQVYLKVSSALNFINCLVEGGKGSFSGELFSGMFQDCFDLNPAFLDPGNFHLQNVSPCIGAGIDSVQILTKWYYAPDYDYDLNPRPNPVNSSPDIGAFENALGIPSTGIKLKL
jgi:parallel beta-helix repeat protein